MPYYKNASNFLCNLNRKLQDNLFSPQILHYQANDLHSKFYVEEIDSNWLTDFQISLFNRHSNLIHGGDRD